MTTEKPTETPADQPSADGALPDEALDQAGGVTYTINFNNQSGNQNGFFFFQKPTAPDPGYMPIAWQVISSGSGS